MPPTTAAVPPTPRAPSTTPRRIASQPRLTRTITWAGMASRSARIRQWAKASGSAGCQKLSWSSAIQRCSSQLCGSAHRSARQPSPRPRIPVFCSARLFMCRPSRPDVVLDPTAEAGLILAQNRCVARTPHLFNPRSASGVPENSKSRATAHSEGKAGSPALLSGFAASRQEGWGTNCGRKFP